MADNAFAGGGPVITGLPETVTDYRLTPAYVRPNLTRFFIFGALGALFLYADSRRAFPDLLFLGTVFSPVAIYNGVAYIWRRRFRTRLTTQGVEIRGYFNHFVPWSDVRGFEVGGFGDSQRLDRGYDDTSMAGPRGGFLHTTRISPTSTVGRRARLGTVYLVRTNGRRMLLRAPLVTSWAVDPYFDQKARQMQEQCNQYGTRPISR
jgi:hypothetical protein